jgi:hypothetical protein
LAKWLPKYRKETRYRKAVLPNGEVKRWKSTVGIQTKAVIAYQNEFIQLICEEMGWTIENYSKWRKENQDTIEQKLSQGIKFEKSPESDIKVSLERMATFARFRVDKIMKKSEKWPRVKGVYQSFETGQVQIAEKMREALASGDEEKVALLQKASKVKTGGGLQTYDLLKMLFENDNQIVDTTHTNLMVKMRDYLDGDLYTIIDWSGSMDYNVPGEKFSYVDVANALAITFSTMHKNPQYKGEFMIFAKYARVIGTTSVFGKGNRFQVAQIEKTEKTPVISVSRTFSKNMMVMKETRRATLETYSPTNMGAVFEHFIDLVLQDQLSVEELPKGLLFITDEEYNYGKHPTECMADAAQIGWFPLIAWWGIKSNKMSSIRCENFLPIGGLSENVLSQVLTYLRDGAVLPGAELLAINDNPRYAKILYTQ